MEETLPTPPATPADGREARSEAELVQAIDELLERYLHLLDEQQKLQEAIGRQFASVRRSIFLLAYSLFID